MEHPTLKFPLIPKLALGCAKEAGNQIFGNVQRGSHAARSRRNGNGTMLTVHKTAMQCWGASTAECSGGRRQGRRTHGADDEDEAWHKGNHRVEPLSTRAIAGQLEGRCEGDDRGMRQRQQAATEHRYCCCALTDCRIRGND